jgi:transposase
VLITAAGIQDRDAAKPLLWNMRRTFPAVKLSWADGGYDGKLVTWAKKALKLTVQIVRRPDDLHTFQVLPRRWVVERTLAWITRCRRTVRDYERLTEHHETIVYWAMIITMSRRLARSQPSPVPLSSRQALTVASASCGRQRTPTDGRSQVRCAARLADSTVTWLRDEAADSAVGSAYRGRYALGFGRRRLVLGSPVLAAAIAAWTSGSARAAASTALMVTAGVSTSVPSGNSSAV